LVRMVKCYRQLANIAFLSLVDVESVLQLVCYREAPSKHAVEEGQSKFN